MNASSPVIQPIRSLQKDEFAWICRYLYENTGIALNEGKQPLVMGRLEKRLRKRGLRTYTDYFALFGRPGYEDESIIAIDLLTTNETYFFREPGHFDFIRQHVLPGLRQQRQIRVWSAASSSGEEAYTLAMVLAEYAGEQQWEILGSDISTRVLEKAQRALYPMQAAEKIKPAYLKKYCLKGRDEYQDYFLIDTALRNKVEFRSLNLIEPLPDIGLFDLIFLRNVMIYFDVETKQKLVQRLLEKLKPGGYFFISHSETLNGINTSLKMIQPSVYRREP